MVIAGLAIVVLGALVVTGEHSAKSGTAPAETLPGSAEVARVTAANAPADRVHPHSTKQSGPKAGHDENEPTGSHHGGKGHPGSGDSSTGGDDGGTPGGGGGEESEPLATVNVPVVGTVTVDDPELPPVPEVDVPDVPGVTLPEVPDIDLP